MRTHIKFDEQGRRVASASRDMFLAWVLPRPLYGLGAPAIYALLDDRLLDAFGFPHPSSALRRTVEGALRLRGRVFAQLPERRKPKLRTSMRRRSYKRGYQIEALGPAEEVHT